MTVQVRIFTIVFVNISQFIIKFSTTHREKGKLLVKAGETAFKTWIDLLSPSTTKS